MFAGGGCAILSYVDLLCSGMEEMGGEGGGGGEMGGEGGGGGVEEVMESRKNVQKRREFVKAVLASVGLWCDADNEGGGRGMGKKAFPPLSHTYLLCSQQVSQSCVASCVSHMEMLPNKELPHSI